MIPPYSQVSEDLRNGKIDLVQLVNDQVEEIKKHSDLNAFIEIFEDSARKRASEIQEKAEKGTLGKLAGMIVAIKDNICYEGHKVGASSKILDDFESLYSSTVVERLLKEDAIIIGRTSCDEFAMGSSNENSVYGPAKNPLDKTKVPGGSSGGSAAAVAAGLCHVAFGSDTGGSIRQPASFTDTVGFKPTYGRVSRYGLIAYASSFDQIGPFGKSVEDVSKVMEVISGRDEFDSTMAKKEDLTVNLDELKGKKLKVAFYKSYVDHEGLDPEIREYFYSLLDKLKSEGHEVIEKEFPYLHHMVPAYYVLTTAEASSNLARYDGIHFGYRSEDAENLEETYVKSRSEGFGVEVKRRIMLGTYVLSAGYYDAYYAKGQQVRRIIKEKTEELLDEVDFILCPTSPHTAFEIGAQKDDPIKMYLEDIFTVQANLSGNPAVSLPMGKHSNGLPFGIQAVGKHFEESALLSFSKQLMNMK